MRKDLRPRVALLTVAAILLGGVALTFVPREMAPAPSAAAASRPHGAQIEILFAQGVVMLHAKRYDHALAAFHKVLKLAPDLPEAHVNMGFALLGLERFAQARGAFEAATALRPRQDNAYYGLAVALEGEGDLRGAIGAMRTYVHLADPRDPHRRRAEAALWEWESSVAKGENTPSHNRAD